MKESIRAARAEKAHKRIVAALEGEASEEKLQQLKAVRQTRNSPEVAMLLEQEAIADIVEGLAKPKTTPSKSRKKPA